MTTKNEHEKAGAVYVNDYATMVVPRDKRRSSFSLAMVLVGSIICLSSIYTGASFAGGLNFKGVIIACLVGNIILTVIAFALIIVLAIKYKKENHISAT